MSETNEEFFQDVKTKEWVHIKKCPKVENTKIEGIYINGVLTYEREL